MVVDPRVRTRSLDERIRAVSARFPLLSAVTPRNSAREHERLLASFRSGHELSPRWEAPVIDRAMLATSQRMIDAAIAGLENEGGWLAIYRERLLELAADLAVIDAAFTPDIVRASEARFGRDLSAGDALAAEFREAVVDDADAETIATDDNNDPRSLVSQMRARISSHSLPVRVLVRERIGSLAAAGDGIVIVAANRRATARETARVVLHEVEGHVLPRERGRGRTHGIETLGSAGASEDEEGRALVIEDRAGLLTARRRRALAARHEAARAVVGGATFVEVVRIAKQTVPLDDALAIAARVMRGGYASERDVTSGIARERVYLPAYARVAGAIAADATLYERLGSGRLSLASLRLLD